MKALSLTQPWATLIAIGAKRIETRSWSTKHRGLIAIHAAKKFPDDARRVCWDEHFRAALAYHELVNFDAYVDLDAWSSERFSGLPRGAIVATARITEVFLTGDTLNYRDQSRTMRGPNGLVYEVTPREIAFGDYSPGRFYWVLTNIQQLPIPIPCKGALGLWEVPAAIYEGIAPQLLAGSPA